jgi:hypothetical protein
VYGLGLVHRLRAKRRNVTTARVAVGKSRDIRGERAVRKAGVTVGWLRYVAMETATWGTVRAGLPDRAVEVLHSEEMRGDLVVPPDLR